jgi:hypothetical protein
MMCLPCSHHTKKDLRFCTVRKVDNRCISIFWIYMAYKQQLHVFGWPFFAPAGAAWRPLTGDVLHHLVS